MKTSKQILGNKGERLVVKYCDCPRCKRAKTLKLLPPNFKCADIICDFCGYLAQVKTANIPDINKLPNTVIGAAWKVQEERKNSGIYIPLFLVQINPQKEFAVYYLPADLQSPEMFQPRNPLSATAKRAGWQGFMYDLTKIDKNSFVRIK